MTKSKGILTSLLVILFFTLYGSISLGQTVQQGLDKPLPANLTEEELQRLEEIGQVKAVTPPPEGEFRLPSEYDKADGVIFSWESYYSSLLLELIKAVSEYDTSFVVVANSTEQSSVENNLEQIGTDLSKVKFIIRNLNSVWMRDYGPWWGLDESGERFILDFIYNRPRPLDDAFPQNLANLWELPYYQPDLVHAGGNFFVDGKGMGFMTSLVLEENYSFSESEIREIFQDYAGLDTVVILTPMQYDGTGHIDMFCKLLNDTTIILGEYEYPSAGAGQNYTILNQNAQQLHGLVNAEGKPVSVERIIMPPYSSGTSYTYTNSLIVNDLVLVPLYGFTTDNEALQLYEDLMPDHIIQGFDCSQIISANGAIHCITKLVMSEQKPPIECLEGDLNDDSEINIQYIVVMVNIILGNFDVTPEYLCAGDLNEDGLINVVDVIILVNILLENPKFHEIWY